MADLAGATVAFDLDGTLVDTAPDLVGTLNAILGEEGLPPLPFDAVRMMVGRGARALLERGFAAAGRPLPGEQSERLLARFIDMYLARIADESRPFPGVEAALAALQGAGARLTVCTNKPTRLSVALIEAVGLSGWFDAIVGPDAAGFAKPDPRHLLAAVGEAERFIQTSLREWAYARPYASSAERTQAVGPWTDAYNLARSHAGIGGLTPWARVNNLLGNDS